MAHRFDESEYTVAREVTQDGSARFLVWTRHGPATYVRSYEATSAADAIRQAREERLTFERHMNQELPDRP